MLADGAEPVALLIADQQMPEMTGIEFLARAHALHPLAKRILLVERDYTTANPTVPAMMLGQIDYHLVKPWFPDRGLYPAVSEFLASWARLESEGFTMFRITALENSARAHEIRDLLTRFNIPFAFHPTDSEDGLALLREVGQAGSRLPTVVRHDGRLLLAIVVRDRASGAVERIPTAGLFVMIGAEPRTEWLDGTVERDEQGYILTGNDLDADSDGPSRWPLERAPLLLETSVPGVFAAGDVRHASGLLSIIPSHEGSCPPMSGST